MIALKVPSHSKLEVTQLLTTKAAGENLWPLFSDMPAARVFEQECIAYPEAIRLFAENRLIIADGTVKILAEK